MNPPCSGVSTTRRQSRYRRRAIVSHSASSGVPSSTCTASSFSRPSRSREGWKLHASTASCARRDRSRRPPRARRASPTWRGRPPGRPQSTGGMRRPTAAPTRPMRTGRAGRRGRGATRRAQRSSCSGRVEGRRSAVTRSKDRRPSVVRQVSRGPGSPSRRRVGPRPRPPTQGRRRRGR